MATKGNTTLYKGILKLQDAFVVIVKTEWNAAIVNRLDKGACRILKQYGISFTHLAVPGAIELPFAVKAYAESTLKKADAFIVLGTVIQGETPHFQYVCQMVSQGIMQLNLQLNAPVIFGVLTVINQKQALERAGGKHGNKGEEAALTAIKMISLQRKLQARKQ